MSIQNLSVWSPEPIQPQRCACGWMGSVSMFKIYLSIKIFKIYLSICFCVILKEKKIKNIDLLYSDLI